MERFENEWLNRPLPPGILYKVLQEELLRLIADRAQVAPYGFDLSHYLPIHHLQVLESLPRIDAASRQLMRGGYEVAILLDFIALPADLQRAEDKERATFFFTQLKQKLRIDLQNLKKSLPAAPRSPFVPMT